MQKLEIRYGGGSVSWGNFKSENCPTIVSKPAAFFKSAFVA